MRTSAGSRPTDGEKVIRTSAMWRVYNVIDARQAEAQNTVIEALRGLGHTTKPPIATPTSPTRWWPSPRAAPLELGYNTERRR